MKKIVIIEDDTDAQETYQEILARQKFRVFPAPTPQLGIQLARSEKPDLIILDLMMPGRMSGIATLKALKHDPRTKSIPVLVVSNLESERKAALERGASGFLGKAATSIDVLLNKINQHAKG